MEEWHDCLPRLIQKKKSMENAHIFRGKKQRTFIPVIHYLLSWLILGSDASRALLLLLLPDAPFPSGVCIHWALAE